MSREVLKDAAACEEALDKAHEYLDVARTIRDGTLGPPGDPIEAGVRIIGLTFEAVEHLTNVADAMLERNALVGQALGGHQDVLDVLLKREARSLGIEPSPTAAGNPLIIGRHPLRRPPSPRTSSDAPAEYLPHSALPHVLIVLRDARYKLTPPFPAEPISLGHRFHEAGELIGVAIRSIEAEQERTRGAGRDRQPDSPSTPHIVGGRFQSDKYPSTPPGLLPLSFRDPMAQDLIAIYARRRRSTDMVFSDDVEICLELEGARPTCETPGCGKSIPLGGEGVPGVCSACINEESARAEILRNVGPMLERIHDGAIPEAEGVALSLFVESVRDYLREMTIAKAGAA
ncbi:MAG: hypothetical protein ACHP7H_00675 [Hyphomicrobiales bacterium]